MLITPESPKIWKNLQILSKHFPLSEFDLMQLGIFDRILNIVVATPWPGVWGLVRVTSQVTPSNCQNSIDFWQTQDTWIRCEFVRSQRDDSESHLNVTIEIWFQARKKKPKQNKFSKPKFQWDHTKINCLDFSRPSLWTESAVSSMISWTLLENIVD